MDAISTFDIDLDVSGCEKLYDYGHSTYHYRPSGGAPWDLDVFSGRTPDAHTNVTESDEHKMVAVDKMDKIVNRSGCMEKNKKKEDEKKGNEVPKWNDFDYQHPKQSLPKRVLPVMKPGDVVKGKVCLELSQPLEVKNVQITMQGRAMTNVRVYHQHGFHDHKGEDVYINETRVAWQRSADGDKDELHDTFALLSTAAADDEPLKSRVLSPGTHTFPFQFTLPEECPGSTPNLIPSSWADYGYVIYRVKAKIDSGKTFTRDPVTYKGLWVDQKLDIAANPEDSSPFSVEESLDTGIAFWKGGTVSCVAKLPRRAFLRGEEIPVTVEVDNKASGDISDVVARVLLRGKSRTGTGKMCISHSINLKAAKVKEDEGVPGGQARVFQMKLPLDFSESAIDSNLIPAGTLSDCPIIDVKYEVNIKVKRPGMHRNIELNIPIKVGNINSKVGKLYPEL